MTVSTSSKYVDPLSELVRLLQLRAAGFVRLSGGGRWAVDYAGAEALNFLTATRGACVISGDFGMVELAEGDFVVLNSRAGFRVGSAPDALAVPASRLRAEFSSGPLQVGWGEEDARVLLGHCELATANSELVTALLPTISVLQKDDLDATTVAAQVTMLVESVVRPRPGSELVIERLADVVLVGLIGRTTSGPEAPAGFLRGLAHPVVGAALQAMHQDTSRPWSVDSLAREAGVSRSTLAAQFLTVTGTTPMAYLLTWRMALAKESVARGEKSHAQIARSVGYGSVSSFSTAFRRHVGRSPAQFAASLKADLA